MMTGLDADEKKRFGTARLFGADILVNFQKDDPVKTVMEATGNMGADAVIDLTGSPVAILQGLEMLRRDGRFCALGLPSGEVPLCWTRTALKAVNLYFSYSSDYTSWERCLSMIKNGKVGLEEFTRDIYSLDGWEEAFERARSGEALKVLIKPQADLPG